MTTRSEQKAAIESAIAEITDQRRTIPCTITYDDGKPKRKGAKK